MHLSQRQLTICWITFAPCSTPSPVLSVTCVLSVSSQLQLYILKGGTRINTWGFVFQKQSVLSHLCVSLLTQSLLLSWGQVAWSDGKNQPESASAAGSLAGCSAKFQPCCWQPPGAVWTTDDRLSFYQDGHDWAADATKLPKLAGVHGCSPGSAGHRQRGLTADGVDFSFARWLQFFGLRARWAALPWELPIYSHLSLTGSLWKYNTQNILP